MITNLLPRTISTSSPTQMMEDNVMIGRVMLLVCVKELEMVVDLKKQNKLNLLSKIRDLNAFFKGYMWIA